jgi:hypothetical protein
MDRFKKPLITLNADTSASSFCKNSPISAPVCSGDLRDTLVNGKVTIVTWPFKLLAGLLQTNVGRGKV